MNSLDYIGIIIFAIGLFTGMFCMSRLRNMQNSFVPVAPSKIMKLQILSWIGSVMFIGGLILSICAFK